MVRWWLLAFLAAGCNELLGLDGTYAEGADPDRDGQLSTDDNCPMVANPDQADADADDIGDVCDACPTTPGPCECEAGQGLDMDGDGIDDACDPCPGGVNHDEDHDLAFDACDRCPGLAGGQEDADGDGVGDACDRSATEADRLRFFDAFAPPQVGWMSPWAGWQRELADGGSIVNVEATSDTAQDPGYTNLDTTFTAYNWRVEVGLIVPPPAGPGTDIGVVLRQSAGDKGIQCLLRNAGTGWQLFAATSTTTETAPAVTLAPGTPVVLVMHTVDPVVFGIRCELVGLASTSELPAPESTFPGAVYLIAAIDGTRFTHVFTTSRSF